MLSHQHSKPTTTDDNQRQQRQQRQHQHQRQQSTPHGFGAHQIPIYPAPTDFSGSHRRGMSLHQPIAIPRQQQPQDYHMVGITNTGHTSQHYLQVAQQHSQARPGLQQPPNQKQQPKQHHQQQRIPDALPLSEEEFRQLQHQQLDAQIDSLFQRGQVNNSTPHSFTSDQHAVKIERSRSHAEAYSGSNVATSPVRSGNGPPAQISQNSQSTRKEVQSAQVAKAKTQASDNEAEGLVKPQGWLQQERPYTPPDQYTKSQDPLTPSTSPYLPSALQAVEMKRARTQDDNSTIRATRSPMKQAPPSTHRLVQLAVGSGQADPNATIKAQRRPAPLQTISKADLFEVADSQLLPSPPNTASLRSEEKTEVVYVQPGTANQDWQLSFSPENAVGYFDGDHSPHGFQQTSPQPSPVYGSPNARFRQYHGDVSAFVQIQASSDASSPTYTARSSVDFELFDSSNGEGYSPGAISISDMNLDATMEDTGISSEEVQSYISQPDPESGKWTCLYPECGKTFGRKENVRAHVQTHLGDRQYKCIHCGKCFVRQHDLKRHSKTHSGVKPYPCRCGNSFARHDALTRHRQRGICTGGFEGIVKKMTKRGRPRKERPSHDDRVDKAARSKKRATAKSYASSVSGTSESSFPESPSNMLEDMDDISSHTGALQAFSSQSFALAPEMLSYSPPPHSPYSAEGSPSPQKAKSTASGNTPQSASAEDDQTAAIFEGMNFTDSNTTKAESNNASQAGSPPELSHSSPPSSTRFLDFDFGVNFDSSGSAPSEAFDKNCSDSADFNDLFTSSWNENTFLNFDKDTSASSGGLFTGSFDDDIMFSDACDVDGGIF